MMRSVDLHFIGTLGNAVIAFDIKSKKICDYFLPYFRPEKKWIPYLRPDPT